MNKNQNLLKAPKISYKVPKKLPSFLDLNNNVNKILQNILNKNFCFSNYEKNKNDYLNFLYYILD